MSHHFDTAIARGDPRLNICDFYLFWGQPGTTVMAMTVNPNAGTKAPDTFHEEGLYAFRFDVNDDAHEEVTFKVRFGEVGHAEGRGPRAGTYRLSRCVGPPEGCRRRHGGRGHRLGHYRPDRRGRRGCADLAGLAPDLFAADRRAGIAHRAAIAAGKFAPDLFHDSANYFQNRNVTAIVMEVPTKSIGDPAATVHTWVTVSLCGHAPEVQVSRWGLPLMTRIFITDEAVKDDYNRSLPSADVPRLADRLGRPPALHPVGGLDRRPGRLRTACGGVPVPDHFALCPRFGALVRFRRLQWSRYDGQRRERDALAEGQHSYRPGHDCP